MYQNPSDMYHMLKDVKDTLKTKRFIHTMATASVASALAMCHGSDVQKAYLAGVFHDYAKRISDKKKLQLCREYGIAISSAEYGNPDLLHGKLGAFLCEKKHGICDPDIQNAITFHTTGRVQMSVLEKIVYVADYIEPNRKELVRIRQIRETAFKDLDQALLLILENTIAFLKKSRMVFDSKTLEAYEYYSSHSKSKTTHKE